MLELTAATEPSAWLACAKTLFGAYGTTAVELLEIIGINILLSGDNAVVIALACRSLPKETRWLGIALGVLAAIVLRIIFTLGLQAIMTWPLLMLIGGCLLFFIALQLLKDGAHDETDIRPSTSVWGAVRTVALADMVMSLDNVLAIAGAAHGKPELIIFGLVTSIPLIVGGAALFMSLFTKFPILVWGGAALLGWIAGELISKESSLQKIYADFYTPLGLSHHSFELACSAAGAALVVLVGLLLTGLSARNNALKSDGASSASG
ncbi:MAG: TerC family protein [Hyphomicrobiaceae bacterium]|nr:TerC family protein [Hyphomicrobiaceae bacterium]